MLVSVLVTGQACVAFYVSIGMFKRDQIKEKGRGKKMNMNKEEEEEKRNAFLS